MEKDIETIQYFITQGVSHYIIFLLILNITKFQTELICANLFRYIFWSLAKIETINSKDHNES